MATCPAEIFICWHTVITSKLSRYTLSSIRFFLISYLFLAAYGGERGGFGDTPNPGKGLCPLHSCSCHLRRRRFWGHPKTRQRTASSALLYYIAFSLIIVNHLVGVFT